MSLKDQVSLFLTEFRAKKKIWGIVYRDDRGKNAQTLADLEMRPIERDKVIDGIEVEDYYQGPLQEKLYRGADMWVFGKKYKGSNIYIKITKGIDGSEVLCISFHIAENEINYPLKN